MSDKDDRATFKIPRELFDRIQKISEKKELGYRNATNFIMMAILEKLERVDPKGSKFYDKKNEKK